MRYLYHYRSNGKQCQLQIGDFMRTEKAVILYSDSSRGKYIPCHFAQTIDRDAVKGIDLAILDQFDDIYFDWEDWQTVLDNCTIQKDGRTWHLYQDGDLWLLDYDNMTEEEKENFGFND